MEESIRTKQLRFYERSEERDNLVSYVHKENPETKYEKDASRLASLYDDLLDEYIESVKSEEERAIKNEELLGKVMDERDALELQLEKIKQVLGVESLLDE